MRNYSSAIEKEALYAFFSANWLCGEQAKIAESASDEKQQRRRKCEAGERKAREKGRKGR